MEPSGSLPPMPSFQDLRRGQAEACQRFKDGLLTTVAKICDATECVFLNSTKIHNTSKQQIGRLSRVMRNYNGEGHINVDAGSPWARHFGRKVMKAIDAPNGESDDVDDGTEDAQEDDHDDLKDYKPIPVGSLVDVTDVILVDIQSDPEYIFIKAAVKEQGIARGLDEGRGGSCRSGCGAALQATKRPAIQHQLSAG